MSTTFSTIGERWKAILGSTVIATIVLMVVMSLLVPVAIGTLFSGMTGGVEPPSSEMSTDFGAVSTTEGITVDANGTPTMPSGTAPVLDPRTSGSTLDSPDVSGPGIGSLFVLFGIGGVIAAISIATASIGVFAAAGSGVGESLKYGMSTSPQVLVQCLKVGWPAIAAYAGMVAAFLLVSPIIGLLLVPVMLVFMLRAGALATVAIGSIAHGHVTYSPELAREAVRGRMGSAVGANLVGGLIGGAASMIPFAGPVFMSAFISAMWMEFGDTAGPNPGLGGSPLDGDDQAATAPAGGVAASPVSYATPAATAAVAATPAAAPTLMAGPNWYLNASPTEPAGSWIQLRAAARVALQVQWVTGDAPVLHLADQAGTWRTPDVQPAATGESTWVDLPAGNTWVALIPREGTQQVWVASWIPDDASAESSSHAA